MASYLSRDPQYTVPAPGPRADSLHSPLPLLAPSPLVPVTLARAQQGGGAQYPYPKVRPVSSEALSRRLASSR